MDTRQKIILLHKDPFHRNRLRQLISAAGHIPFCFESVTICLDNFGTLQPDLIMIGPFSLYEASRFVNFIKFVDCRLPIVMIGADRTVQDFCISNGFDDIWFENDNATNRDINEKLLKRTRPGEGDVHRESKVIVGNSPEMVKLRKRLFQISKSEETVLIQGETGTGKDLAAQVIHQCSHRKESPLSKINFKAFTDAPPAMGLGSGKQPLNTDGELNVIGELLADRKEGTLFLDGIEHLPLPLQGKLENILEKSMNVYVGNGQRCQNKRRIVVGTCMDLEALVDNGFFNKDLYCRISVFNIKIPPLRKHPEDISLMIDYVSDMYCHKLSNGICEVPANIKESLKRYNWPGNFTELEQVVRKMIDTGFNEKAMFGNDQGRIFGLGLLSPKDAKRFGSGKSGKELKKIPMKGVCRQIVAETEARLIREALQYTNWNRKKAAHLLDISYRSLLNKIKAYGLS